MNLTRHEENLMKILGCVWFCKIWGKIRDKEKRRKGKSKKESEGKKNWVTMVLKIYWGKIYIFPTLPVICESINIISFSLMLYKKHKSIIIWVVGRFEFIYIHFCDTSLYDIVIFV